MSSTRLNQSTDSTIIGWGTCDFCHATCTKVASGGPDETRICRTCVTRHGGAAVARHLFDTP